MPNEEGALSPGHRQAWTCGAARVDGGGDRARSGQASAGPASCPRDGACGRPAGSPGAKPGPVSSRHTSGPGRAIHQWDTGSSPRGLCPGPLSPESSPRGLCPEPLSPSSSSPTCAPAWPLPPPCHPRGSISPEPVLLESRGLCILPFTPHPGTPSPRWLMASELGCRPGPVTSDAEFFPIWKAVRGIQSHVPCDLLVVP